MNLILDAFTYLADPANWAGPAGLGARLGEHLVISAAVVLAACLIGLPAGVAAGHTGRGKALLVVLTGGARSIPTLGLLTLLALAMGIGLTAPFFALTVLALPSVVAGAYAGVESVERETVGAARALGMTGGQLVWQVELPLGAHVIVGGVRTATLQVISTATLAAYVADAGLGRILFAGLSANNYPMMLASAFLVIGLAIAVDLLFSWIQHTLKEEQ